MNLPTIALPATASDSANWHPELFTIGCGPQPHSDASPARLGIKAFNLLRMAGMGLPVPPGFVLGTGFCADAGQRVAAATPSLWAPAMRALEASSAGLKFGDAQRPLLLSVRSGAPVSMPGMMETLLNIGLSDSTVQGLIRQTGNPRLAWDAYRRLVASYGEVVAGLPASLFADALTSVCDGRHENQLDFAELRSLTRHSLLLFAEHAGHPFPQDPQQQLQAAIAAVFDSWQSAKACSYRQTHDIDAAIGTAVTVQRMVFGNAGARSGAGVGFTRDPRSGAPELWVDFLFNAQGEDVVSGRRSANGHGALQDVLPQAWGQLQAACSELERAFGDMQDFEFTVQDRCLFMLQTRDGKRTPQAAARIALDLCKEGVIDRATALRRCAGLDAHNLRISQLAAASGQPLRLLARAAAASSGVAIGQIALDEASARAAQAAGQPVVLLRRDAETGDMAALELAAGLLTQHGARTSHAAVVARQMGRVCLVGCEGLQIDETRREVIFPATESTSEAALQEPICLAEGELISLDGNEGCVYAGAVQMQWVCPQGLLDELDELRASEVYLRYQV